MEKLFISQYIVFIKLNIFMIHLLFLTQLCYSAFGQIEMSQFDNISHYDEADGISSTNNSDILEDTCRDQLTKLKVL